MDDTTIADSDPYGESYEAQHVHAVYEQIAPHFSSTRYKVFVPPFRLPSSCPAHLY